MTMPGGRVRPDEGSGRQATHTAITLQDGPSSQKTDPAYDLGRYAAFAGTGFQHRRQLGEDGRSKANKNHGAKSGRFELPLAFDTD
jgi:hypothetical protein